MTVYTLTHPKIISMPINIFFGRITAWALEINGKKAIPVFLGMTLALAVVIYLTSLFASFNYGFQIQEREKNLQNLEQLLVAAELTFQKLHTNFGENHKDALSSMEKISKIRYIAPESFVDASTIKSR